MARPWKPGPDDDRWYAFRSLCTTTGCVATGTKLDNKNPQAMYTPAVTSVWHFTDNHWQETPIRSQENYPKCLGVDGKIVAGARTEASSYSLEPQADGMLRGVVTVTVVTNECGGQGVVEQTPVVATRTADAPAGVNVADPATVPSAPSPSSPAPPAAGPKLEGTYRVDYDDADQTVNGKATTGDEKKETSWWAFRSLCTSTRCVATAAALADNNQQEPSGGAHVVQFTDGRWQDTPYLLDPAKCQDQYQGSNDPRRRRRRHSNCQLVAGATTGRNATRRFHDYDSHRRVRQAGQGIQDAHCGHPDW